MSGATVLGTLEAAGDAVPKGYQDLADTVIGQLEQHLEGCIVYTTIFEADENLYKVVAVRGGENFGGGIEAGLELPLDRTYCFQMATDNGPRFAPDSRNDPVYSEVDPGGIFGAYAGSPIEFDDGSRVGSLCVMSAEAGGIDEAIVPMISVLAGTLAAALEKEIEVEELRAANAELSQQATTDSLTGVTNRRAFEHELSQAWQLARRGTMASFLFLADIDAFKLLNDKHGHLVGDLVLTQLADSLEDSARESDVVGRVGGDEFAVILHGCRDGDEADIYRRRAGDTFTERAAANKLEVSVSLGYSDLATADSPERAVEEADQTMYEFKRETQTN